MDADQITKGLSRLFVEEKERIVFWHDPERDFLGTLTDLKIPEVTLLRLDETPALAVKLRLEQDDPDGRYLLYAPSEEPNPDNDWLLDIRLYSRTFRADVASIVLDQLGLTTQSLRPHVAKRQKFFANKERLAALKKHVEDNDKPLDIDRKILAVVTKADLADFYSVILAIVDQMGSTGLDELPAVWDEVAKYGLEEPFWELVDGAFGYTEDKPSIKNLLLRLMATDYAHATAAKLPSALGHLVVPSNKHSSAVYFLNQWRDSSSKGNSYDILSGQAAEILKIADHLAGVEAEQILDAATFLDIDRHIVRELRDRVQGQAEALSVEALRDMATRRQDGHWASCNLPTTETVPREALWAAYEAIATAAELFESKKHLAAKLSQQSAADMVNAYCNDMFRCDQLYRCYSYAADLAQAKNWDLLKNLSEQVDDCYINGFVAELALGWDNFFAQGSGASLLAKWQVASVPQQRRFFDHFVVPSLDKSGNRKVFVIISDALRYEAAEELNRELNGKYRIKAQLSAQLGVLPSYTSLGMAALMPHETLEFKANGDLLVDGKPAATIEQRGKLLEPSEGVAFKATALWEMNKDEGRAAVKGKQLVYIYHNVIDATGDSASTEVDTFKAVADAIRQLSELVSYVVNNLSATTIFVTADHGFLYQRRAHAETDKSKLLDKPAGTVKSKKRYLLGRSLPDNEKVWHGSTEITAGAQGEMEFWVPKGANLFHFAGGSRFVHGGATLQEVIVPVISVKQIKGKAAAKTTVKQVSVQVLGGPHKITTNTPHRFRLLQTEKVSERVKPSTLQVGVYEESEPVTNIETVTFDSVSGDMDERSKWVSVALKDKKYNKKTTYHLVLRNADTGVEEQRVEVIIDKAFDHDF